MSTELVALLPEEVEQFLLNHRPRYFFSQSPEYFEWNLSQGFKAELLGLKEAGEIIAYARVIYLPFKRLFYSAEISFAPISINSKSRSEIFSKFISQLVPYFEKQKRVLRLRISPNIVARNFTLENIETNHIASASAEAEEAKSILRANGLTDLGEDFFTNPGSQPRYLYVKDLKGLDIDEVMASLSYRARNDMRRCQRYGIKVRFLQASEVEIFNDLLRQTVERTGMKSWHPTYLTQQMLEILGDQVLLPMAYIRPEESLAGLRAEGEEFDQEIAKLEARPQTKKTQNRIKQVQDQKAALDKRVQEIQDLGKKHGPEIHLACGHFAQSKTDLINLQYGVANDFIKFSPVYAIHEKMLAYAVDHAHDYYNFFAIENPFLPAETMDQGVFDFKEHFNGHIEEYLGTWEKIYRLGFLQ